MKVVVFLSVISICFSCSGPFIGGGLGCEEKATPEVQGYADKLRGEIEFKAGVKFNKFRVVAFKAQIVEGINYFMKIEVGDNAYIHVRVHKSLSGNTTLSSLQFAKSREDSIVYFE